MRCDEQKQTEGVVLVWEETDMVDRFTDLWFGFVLQIGPLGPVERDGTSSLRSKKKQQQKTSVMIHKTCC